MSCFIKRPGSGRDPSELKAILFALGACFLFIGLLTAANRSKPGKHKFATRDRTYQVPPPLPVQPPDVVTEVPAPPPSLDVNQRFRFAPKMFQPYDFKNRSYGNYILSDGKETDLALINGQFRLYTSSSHWFDLNDVFYTDVTGDGGVEAIALLTHLECNSSACDGGKSLIYVYSLDHGRFDEILKYESGSGINGCSLKSLIVKNRQLTLESFGKCPAPTTVTADDVRGKTYDLTRVDFRFNGKQLVPRDPTYFTVPDCHEVTSGVQVRISEERFPVEPTIRKRCV